MPYAVFIDRDGTINEDRGYVHKIEEFQLLSGVIEALWKLTQHGILIYIVTNQSGIAKGYYKEEDFQRLMIHVLQLFHDSGIRIEKVLFCPHHPEGSVKKYRKICDCRKPGTALIQRVIEQRKLQFKDIAIIGDKNSDIETGRRLGIKTYLVETGFGALEKASTQAHHVLPNLKSCVDHLLQYWRLNGVDDKTNLI